MQKQFLIIVAIPVCIGLVAAASLGQTPLGTAFTYQGQLKNNGQPASGTFDIQFKLFDAATNGTQAGTTQCADNVAVSNGLFTANVDFGPQFDGNSRWLEIAVRGDTLSGNCAISGGYFTLAPRQPMTATPYASFAAAPWTRSGTNLSYTAGNVGIGTTAPGAPLDVVGVSSAIRGTTSGVGSYGVLGISNSPNGAGVVGSSSNGSTGVEGIGSGSSYAGAFYGNVLLDGPVFVGGSINFLVAGNTPGQMAYLGGLNALSFKTNSTEAMRIDSSGNVGIGFAAPSNRLSVAGAMDVTGSVGIGTTSPATSLHIVDPALAQVKLERTGGASLLLQAGTTVTRVGSTTTTRLGFLIGGNDKMTLDTAGHLGIGTTAPDSDLHVVRASAGTITANANAPLAIENNTTNYLNLLAPDASETGILFGRPGSAATSAAGGIIFNNSSNADGLQFRTGGNLNRMTIDSAGNVGIGTTNPTAKLHVVGSSGDASVILPNSSIAAAEIADEPGVACDIVNSGDLVFLFSSRHTAASRSINCPAGGYVLAMGTVTLSAFSGDGHINVGISDSSSALLSTCNHRQTVLDGKYNVVHVQGLFNFTTAGSRTLYLLVQPDPLNAGREFGAGPAHLTLLYLPTAYGTVDLDN